MGAAELKKKEDEKQAQEEREKAEKERLIQEKRQKAVEAYNRMQAKLKESAIKPSADFSTASTTTQVMKNDPFQVKKDVCRSLIVLCESMRPPARKNKRKKKNSRLVYRADSFAKFNQVGIKIPKYSKQLDETIEALRNKILSYDKKATDEPAKVEETEEVETAQTEEKAT